MMYVLENDLARVTISTRGAEVQSFILKEDQTEYIWQGNPEIWAGRAPLVFPVVGRLKEDEYTFEGKTYHMGQHGFGSVSEFVVTEQERDEIVFSLKYNDITLQMYPFKFELQIRYSLKETTLTKTHTMINLDDKVLYYAIGGHDGYNLCLDDGEVFEDYYLDFGGLEKLNPLEVDEHYHILRETYDLPLHEGKLPLTMKVFQKGALVCHDFPVKNISIRSRKSGRALQLEFGDFKTIGIWTKYLPKAANYICLEPWSTLPDCAYLGKTLEEKVDIRNVLPGTMDRLAFSVTI
ncbi:MAG: aldose 1-epimerase family protein [Lachnospiraceae bacterium]|nr:aldose 1-epimerase family protein [Lachnospiraceae bacterium]